MIEVHITPASWRAEEGLPDECLAACVDEDELHGAVEQVTDDAQMGRDVDTLLYISNSLPRGLWRSQLFDIAKRWAERLP